MREYMEAITFSPAQVHVFNLVSHNDEVAIVEKYYNPHTNGREGKTDRKSLGGNAAQALLYVWNGFLLSKQTVIHCLAG